MKARIGYFSLLFSIFILILPGMIILAVEGTSPFYPAPAGVRLSGIVECGHGYTSHELYDMKITLQEVIRGTEAWERLKKTSNTNKPADQGFEYVLARIRFEYWNGYKVVGK